ncbi:MAG: sulfatase [Thermodesulfobacteriota bacterium]
MTITRFGRRVTPDSAQRRRLGLCAALAVVVAFLGGWRQCEPASPPNVVLISIDTLRPDHLGAYGYARPTSPNIDALAARGVVFENAFSPSSWTLPAHATLLSGVSPYRHGAVTSATRIRDDVPLLAETLAARGYHTAAFVNAPFVSQGYGFARGFARFEQRFTEKRAHVAARQRAILEAVAELEPPFFLFVHYMDVHTPYRPPKAFNRFAADRRGGTVLKGVGAGGFLELQRAVRDGKVAISNADRDRLVDLYDGEILAVDAKIGELVRALEREPDTVIVLTSDHGEEFLEHSGVGHAETLYDEVLRVPLIVTGPGIAPGRAKTFASLADVVPTFLDWLGGPVPAGLDGRSLVGALRRSPVPDDDVVLALHTSSHDGRAALRGVRSAGHKLIQDDASGRAELYDVARDPGERTNLLPGAADDRLAQILARLSAPSTVPAPRPNEETVESLKALGYL